MEEILYDVGGLQRKCRMVPRNRRWRSALDGRGRPGSCAGTLGADSIKRFADEAKNIGVIFTPEQIAAARWGTEHGLHPVCDLFTQA